MAGEDGVEAFLFQHLQRLLEAKEHMDGGGADELLRRAAGHHVPAEIMARRLGLARHFQRLVADARHRHAGGQHQALLAAADGEVDAPGVHLVFHAAQRGDRVGQQQRRMLGLVDGAADLGQRQHHAGRGLVMDGQHGLDLVLLVPGQTLGDLRDIGALADIGRDQLDLDAEVVGHLGPASREIAGLDHQHGLAGREQVGECGFPGAVAGRRVHEQVLVGLEHPLHAVVAGVVDGHEFVRHEVDHGAVHRPQHTLGNVGRARIVEELASAGLGVCGGHCALHSGKRRGDIGPGPLAKQARLAMLSH